MQRAKLKINLKNTKLAYIDHYIDLIFFVVDLIEILYEGYENRDYLISINLVYNLN